METNEKDLKPLDRRSLEELNAALGLASHTVYKQYLNELCTYTLVEPGKVLLDEDMQSCVRAFRLTQLTCRKGEDIFQKLSNVYHAAMSLGCSLFVMVDVEGVNQPAEIYLGIRNPDPAKNPKRLSTSYSALRDGLLSNFPGTQVEGCFDTKQRKEKLEQKLNDIFGTAATCISAVSCVASSRDKSRTEHKSFVQGIEKLIDVMRGKAYTALFIAEPVSPREQSEIRSGYESLYSTLSSFRKSVWSYNETESRSVMESLSHGISKTITEGISHTQSHTITQTKGSSNMVGVGGGISFGIKLLKSLVGLNFNYSHGQHKDTAEAEQTGEATMYNKAEGVNDVTVKGTTDTVGTGRTLQVENTNKSIEELLQRIEEQLKRVREGEDYGAYSCGAYFLSGKQDSSLLAASTYRALMLGEGSSVESGAVNFWNEPEVITPMKEYLRRFAHPVFALPQTDDIEQVIVYSPGTIVSGLELPLHLGLPTKSVVGLPVVDHAEFGRNTAAKEPTVRFGGLYHMGQVERETEVRLNTQSLASHIFITGSTGAGKSNAVYHILDGLLAQNVRFLVIEPAKGEYKQVLGGREDVAVYGTNLKKLPLLQINPFSFPEDTHVLEHIDRLVEIFNACWPMYAAMPAVLKDAVEQAYRSKGWDLSTSRNVFGAFPTFEDLNRELPEVMKKSSYSADTKSDYVGALVTRVKSLTNGINGQIFCSGRELSDEALFDRNVIVDLSRVGSQETKSLLMGILVMKLQEYRMSNGGMNSGLRHVTVLEEAHNLLRRTSDVQTQEGSNLQGKSVEMIANAIAEMRTYGEGFIIADQAPGLMDPAVTRNTNTKIILRLPDKSDRELVGRAASLNDDQIVELSKLPVGVAAVYQNDWLEPVLCKVDLFDQVRSFSYDPHLEESLPDTKALFARILYGCETAIELSKEQMDCLKGWIDQLDTGRAAKELLRVVLSGHRSLTERETGCLLYCVTKGRTLIEWARGVADSNDVPEKIERLLVDMFDLTRDLAREVRIVVFQYAASRMEQDEAQYQELLRYGRMS